jgi:HlyD family secretion protein
MKKALVTLVALSIIGGSVYAYLTFRRAGPEPTVQTAAVTRGDVADTVGATGTLQAVTSVQVGTQVSGTVMELHADFNSLVRKGQVLARLDPSLFETQIEQARANLIRAQAELERLRVTLDDARTKLSRAKELASKQLIAQTELDTAEVTVRSTEAGIRSAEASVTQAQASLNQNRVNLQHTVITAPIDGLVVSRNVDVGQTVAASMNAPTLYVLAADLTKMQVVANLDESDVGRIRPGQHVTFRVDAYPADDFTGRVAQVRLQPIVQQNVVTYATVIDVQNPELKLKPGMTANVNIEIARRSDVVRVPNAALRFRPTNEIFAALGQAPPAPGGGRGDMTGRSTARPNGKGDGPTDSATGRGPAPATPGGRAAPQPQSEPGGRGSSAGGGAAANAADGDRSERRRMIAERLQGLPPEERQRMLEQMRARGIDPTENGGRGSGTSRGGRPAPPQRPPATAGRGSATTIDALFGPLPRVETRGRVWLYENHQLVPRDVRLGISDGQATELIAGDIEPGMQLVTNVNTGQETRPAMTGPGFPPFMGGGRGRDGGGNRGGNPGNGGRGR